MTRVGRVGDRPGRRRQALHPRHREPEVSSGLTQVTLRDGAGTGVADGVQRVGGDRLDLLEVVVAAAHLVAQRRVGSTCPQRTGETIVSAERRAPLPSSQLPHARKQRDDVLERGAVETSAEAFR